LGREDAADVVPSEPQQRGEAEAEADGGGETESLSGHIAGVGPAIAAKLDETADGQAHRGVRGAAGGGDLVVDLQRNVAIDVERRRQAERADTADLMARQP